MTGEKEHIKNPPGRGGFLLADNPFVGRRIALYRGGAVKQSAENGPYKTNDVRGRFVRLAINFRSLFLVLDVSVFHDSRCFQVGG